MKNIGAQPGQFTRIERMTTVVAMLLFSLLVLTSLALAYLGFGSYSDPSAGVKGRLWSMTAVAVAGFQFLANIVALTFVIRRDPAIWIASAVLLVVTLVGFVALIPAGFGMLAELQQSGTDYTGLGSVGCLIFGVALPMILGLLNLGGGACLLVLRRQIDNRRLPEQRLPL
jgi:hypothetical protein